ncbi:MAG: hypothetical protein PHR36_03105 [Patescibacteria group bacterium]|nr:hypothetical protein [Patescibacteria group bacterium]
MQNQLQKAINLAKITGDKIIVIDSSKPESAFVIMGLDEYEKFVLGRNELRSLTEEELLDRINRDIAIWKSENDENAEENREFLSERKDKISPFFCKNWPEENKEDDFFDEDTDFDEDEDEDEEDMYYYEDPSSRMELDDGPDELEEDDYIQNRGVDRNKNKFGNHWEIPSDIKSSAEEVVKDIPF